MSSPYCKFVYNSGGGNVTFQPTWPARKQPGIFPIAVRHDNIASSGVKESVLERIDNIFDLDFPMIPTADVASWTSFLAYALTGGSFEFFPDQSSASYTNYTLDTTDATLGYVSLGIYSLKLKLRQVVT